MNTLWKWTTRIMSGLLILIFGLTALTYLAGVFAKRQLARANMPPGQLTNVGAFNMHIYCTGEGSPTVILEAGLNDFFVTWSKVQPEVARVTRVCSYDRAGLGWSDTSLQPRTSQVMLQELRTLLRNTGVEGPFVLVGHSFGGINMRQFAQKHPDDVVGLVLVDSAHEEQVKRLPYLKQAADEFVSQFGTLSLMNSFGLMALSPATIPNRGFPDQAYDQYKAVLATTDYFDGAIAESTAFYANALNAPEKMGELPIIVLSHGLFAQTNGINADQQEQFEQEWTKMQKELANLSSNSKQVVAEKSGHHIQLDQPDLVIESILELVQAAHKIAR